MSKLLIGVFMGVFVGALAYEFLSRTRPGLLAKIRERVNA